MAELLEKLVRLDYDDEYEATVSGEFARRGGIIDIFSPAHDFPCRVEFFGDTIDSLRSFAPETQRSTGAVEEYRVIGRAGITAGGAADSDLFAYFEERDYRLLTLYPSTARERIERYSGEAALGPVRRAGPRPGGGGPGAGFLRRDGTFALPGRRSRRRAAAARRCGVADLGRSRGVGAGVAPQAADRTAPAVGREGAGSYFWRLTPTIFRCWKPGAADTALPGGISALNRPASARASRSLPNS